VIRRRNARTNRLGKRNFRKLVDDFSRILTEQLSRAQPSSGPNVARLIYVHSKSVRRQLRSNASARTSITEASWLIIGLAYLHPERLIESTTWAPKPSLERSRLMRTFQNEGARYCWSLVQANRVMVAVESASIRIGYDVEWILEGLDREKIAEILAIPDDHQILGFLAINRPDKSSPAPDFPILSGIDFNGFGGNWPIVQQDSGPQPS
jgi:hypothetical protein